MFGVEFGTTLHWLHGSEVAFCTPGNPFCATPSQQDFFANFWQHECWMGAAATVFARPKEAANMCGQKNRCSPVEHSHSGAWMPDHNAAGIMAETSTTRIGWEK